MHIYVGGHPVSIQYLRETLADYGLKLVPVESENAVPWENREVYRAVKEGAE